MYPPIEDKDRRYEKRELRTRAKEAAKQLARLLSEVDACMAMFDSDVPMLYLKLQDGAKALGERAYRLAGMAEKLFEIRKEQQGSKR